MTNNGKICKNCGHKYFGWDPCCQEPLFNTQTITTDTEVKMPEITLEEHNSLIKTVKELQRICKKWRRHNKELKSKLERLENLNKGIPDFLKGFGKNGGRYD